MSDVETYEEMDAVLTGIQKMKQIIRIDTANLWVGCYTYSHKDSLRSDWLLHLWTVSQMVPYFFASAHVDYRQVMVCPTSGQWYPF